MRTGCTNSVLYRRIKPEQVQMRATAGGPKVASLPNLSLRTKGVLVVAIPVCALLVAIVVFYRFDQQLQRAEAAVERAFEVRADIRTTLLQMVDAETGIRGCLLTHNSGFLQPYDSARRQLPLVLQHLHRIISPDQAPELAIAEALEDHILAELARALEAPPAAALSELEADKANMDELRGRLSAMQAHEDQILATQTAQERRLETRLRATIFTGGALGLLGGILGIVIFTTGIARRIERLVAQAHDMAAGRIINHQIRGHDELTRLEHTLQQTSELVARQSAELRAGQSELEARVRDRTSELESANEELRQAKEVSEAVIQASPLAIWAIDLNGNVQFWNPAAQAIFGWTALDVIGRLLPIVPPDQLEEYDAGRKASAAVSESPASSANASARMARSSMSSSGPPRCAMPPGKSAAPSPSIAISPSTSCWRNSSASRRSWKRWASWPAAWPTISTTS